MVNIGKVYRYGVELNMKFDVSDTLLLSANYTWLEQENRSNDDKFTDTPEHAAMLTLAWEIDNNVDLLVSERMEPDRNSDSEGEHTTAGFATTDNGLKDVLISDRHAAKVAMSMDLHIGHMVDAKAYRISLTICLLSSATP